VADVAVRISLPRYTIEILPAASGASEKLICGCPHYYLLSMNVLVLEQYHPVPPTKMSERPYDQD